MDSLLIRSRSATDVEAEQVEVAKAAPEPSGLRASGVRACSRRRQSAPLPKSATIGLLCVAAMTFAGTCTHSDSPPATGTQPPTVSITLNAVPDEMNDLLVVPPTGFVINIAYEAGDLPIDPSRIYLADCLFGWGCWALEQATASLSAGATSAIWQVPEGYTGFAVGSHMLHVLVGDTEENYAYNEIAFAVRDFPDSPPIETGQNIWFDFDFDSTRDFSSDLEVFGLGSPSAPAASAKIESHVTELLLIFMSFTYHWSNPNGLPAPDPVAVEFFDHDPGEGDVTRICVGGQDPTGGQTIGNILIDPNNANRVSIECGSLPPTGIFPSELMAYQSDPAFQETFDSLQPSRGGTPVGEDPADAVVLADGFNYLSGTPEQRERYADIYSAAFRFASVLGTILAHETGHALGLVPPAAPGIGLHGGVLGAAYSHAVTPDGVAPSQNYIMKAGNAFSFAALGGLDGHPWPSFRPLNFAYLRDRAVAYVPVTELLPPPMLLSAEPAVLESSSAQLIVTGEGFAGVPTLRLANESYSYDAIGETLVSESVVTGWVIKSQIPSGMYDLEIHNPDGQEATFPNAFLVP